MYGSTSFFLEVAGQQETHAVSSTPIDNEGSGPITLADIKAARTVIAEAVEKTPCDRSRTLSEMFGARSGSSSRICSSRDRSRSAARSTG